MSFHQGSDCPQCHWINFFKRCQDGSRELSFYTHVSFQHPDHIHEPGPNPAYSINDERRYNGTYCQVCQVNLNPMSTDKGTYFTSLPDGYRWATEDEIETWISLLPKIIHITDSDDPNMSRLAMPIA